MISKEYLEEEYVKKQRKSSDIAKELNVSESTVNNYRRKYCIPKNKRKPINFKDLSNQVFGKLLVIERVSSDKHRKATWKCLCDCGRYTTLPSIRLISGKVESCGCGRKRFGKNNPAFTGYEDISGTQIRLIEYNAFRRGLEYNLSDKFLWDLFLNQDGKCAMTDLPLTFRNKHELGTASLDRIDSSKGYIEGNVQWVHKHINKMKWDYNNEYFIEICNLISKKNPR